MARNKKVVNHEAFAQLRDDLITINQSLEPGGVPHPGVIDDVIADALAAWGDEPLKKGRSKTAMNAAERQKRRQEYLRGLDRIFKRMMLLLWRYEYFIHSEDNNLSYAATIRSQFVAEILAHLALARESYIRRRGFNSPDAETT